MKLILLGTIAAIISTSPAFSFGALQSQRVDGFDRYCGYTDGGVLTVGSTDLCPPSNMGADEVFNIRKSAGFGSLSDQTVNGFHRYCSYTDGQVLTVGATDLCPISSQ